MSWALHADHNPLPHVFHTEPIGLALQTSLIAIRNRGGNQVKPVPNVVSPNLSMNTFDPKANKVCLFEMLKCN